MHVYGAIDGMRQIKVDERWARRTKINNEGHKRKKNIDTHTHVYVDEIGIHVYIKKETLFQEMFAHKKRWKKNEMK